MILEGDCVEKMRELDEASVDAIVTDPPYHLTFMGRTWDHAPSPAESQTQHLAWATEGLRVLKPGGHLLAFGGTRTYHRLACAIEDAGFEIRDCLVWMYGSGFPKSLDVSKAIDKAAGAEREVTGHRSPFPPDHPRPNKNFGKMAEAVAKGNENASALGFGREDLTADGIPVTAPATPEAAQWEGWGTALKPAHEPIVLARKPLVGTVAANVLEHGTGALNIDGCRIGSDPGYSYPNGAGGNTFTVAGEPDGTRDEPVESSSGRWPANVALSHLPECVAVGTRKVKRNIIESKSEDSQNAYGDGLNGSRSAGYRDDTMTVWECAEGCPIAMLDEQSGERKAGGTVSGNEPSAPTDNAYGEFTRVGFQGIGDSGGASRFMATFASSTMEECAGLGEGSTRDESTSAGRSMESSTDNSPTDGSGSKPTDQSPAATTSTTETTTDSTTTSQTSNSSSADSTSSTTAHSEPPRSSKTENESAPDAESGNPSAPSQPEPTDPDSPTAGSAEPNISASGESETGNTTPPTCAPIDSGSQPRFRYEAKASRFERNAGLDGFEERGRNFGQNDPKSRFKRCAKCGRQEVNMPGSECQCDEPEWVSVEDVAARANNHPTVKPIDLMRWLVRLVTPPGGTVLDPFAGSGTTGIAAVLEGFNFLGIEREEEYAAIARARIEWWSQFPGESTEEILVRAGLSERIEREHQEAGQLGLEF